MMKSLPTEAGTFFTEYPSNCIRQLPQDVRVTVVCEVGDEMAGGIVGVTSGGRGVPTEGAEPVIGSELLGLLRGLERDRDVRMAPEPDRTDDGGRVRKGGRVLLGGGGVHREQP